ncbi:hypothetical protein [Rhizobium leguminosarum]
MSQTAGLVPYGEDEQIVPICSPSSRINVQSRANVADPFLVIEI